MRRKEMTQKTNYSFDVQYPANSDSTEVQRNEVMSALGPALQQLLAVNDSAASVVVSESHRGNGNKLVELTTTLQDSQIAEVLQDFSSRHGVTVTALE